jgi:hypothetical protein
METVFGLVLVIMILRTDSVVNWFVCVNKSNNLKGICFKFFREVFEINHRLFVGIYLNSRRIISILCPVLLLECSCVAHIAVVTNAVDCDYCKLFVILANTDVTPASHPARYFPDRRTCLAQCPNAAVAVPLACNVTLLLAHLTCCMRSLYPQRFCGEDFQCLLDTHTFPIQHYFL